MGAVLRSFPPAKRFAAIICGLALGLLGPGVDAGAQERPEVPAQRREGVRGRGLRLMQRLNLSREQRRRLREIRQQSEPEVRELARRMRQARRALDEAIYADVADEALIEQRSRELAVLQNLLTHQRALNELKVRRVLTDEQLRLFRDLRREAQRRQMLQRRAGRAARPSAAPSPEEPGDSNTPPDTQPDPPAPNPGAPRRRRP